jgi:hypothetical protein
LRGLLLLLLATSLVAEWSLRPKLFTLLALSLTLTLIVSRRDVWLPLVFLLWANLHGAVALGVVVLGAACLEAALHDRRRLPRLLLVSAISIGATAVTPLGFSLMDDVVLSLRRPDFAYIREWQPAGREAWTYALFVVAPAAALLAWHHRRSLSSRERVLLYVSAALLPLAVRYARNVPIFLLAAGPLLSALLVRCETAGSLFQSSRARTTPLTAPLAAAALVAAAAIAYGWTARPPRLAWDPMPQAAADAIRTCGQPLYNHFDNGGHLIWFVPEQPVFIDSRQHPYPGSFIVDHFRVEDSGDYHALFAAHQIRCAVLPPSSRVGTALVRDGWRVAYRDSDWLVVLRPGAATVPARSSPRG